MSNNKSKNKQKIDLNKIKEPQELLLEFSYNLFQRRKDFELCASSDKFDIYKHKTIAGLELAVLRQCSDPHYHSESTYFCFMKNSIIVLGGIDNKGIGHVTQSFAKGNQVYPISAYMLHAAGPLEEEKDTELLIYTPSGDRARQSEYPDDTYKPEDIVWE